MMAAATVAALVFVSNSLPAAEVQLSFEQMMMMAMMSSSAMSPLLSWVLTAAAAAAAVTAEMIADGPKVAICPSLCSPDNWATVM